MKKAAKKSIGRSLQKEDYNRERSNPKPYDRYYLHLSDLLTALKNNLPKKHGRVLDYGCGGSPYQFLFQASEYHRADYLPAPGLDYLIDARYRTKGAKSSYYDVILSTQVLEHVEQPYRHLKELHRLLVKKGKLLLTTHGVFPDHPCPHDYHRWTAEGLTTEIKEAGFYVRKMIKLTTNLRAILCLAEDHVHTIHESRIHLGGIILDLFKRKFWRNREKRNVWIDKKTEHLRVIDQDPQNKHPLYIALLVVAEKK